MEVAFGKARADPSQMGCQESMLLKRGKRLMEEVGDWIFEYQKHEIEVE